MTRGHFLASSQSFACWDSCVKKRATNDLVPQFPSLLLLNVNTQLALKTYFYVLITVSREFIQQCAFTALWFISVSLSSPQTHSEYISETMESHTANRTTTRCADRNDICQSVGWTELAYIERGVCLRWCSKVILRFLLTLFWLSSEPGIGIFCKCYCIILQSMVWQKKDALKSQNRSGLVSQLPRLPILLPWVNY